jgi:hypothetical protein
MLEKLGPPFRFALPKRTSDGELLGHYTKFIQPLRADAHSTSHEARLNGVRACVTVYPSKVAQHFFNPAKLDYEALQRVRAALPEAAQHLPRPIGWLTDKFLGPMLATELVVDWDGRPSNSLAEVASVTPLFTATLREVLSKIYDRQIPLNVDASQILVQRTQTGDLNPILIDATRHHGSLGSISRSIISAVLPACYLAHRSASITRTLALSESKVLTLPPATGLTGASPLASLTMPR